MVKAVTKVDLGQIGPINQNVNYDGQSTTGDDLNDLDLVARYVLAATHSSWKAPLDSIAQNVTGKKTFACMASGDTLYIAHNAGLISGNRGVPKRDEEDAICEAALGYLHSHLCMKIQNVVIVNRTTKSTRTSYHAEMQLVTHFLENDLQVDGGVIGVSKPCCSNCSNRLTALGVDHSLVAVGEAMGQWVLPDGEFQGILGANNNDPLR